MLEMKRLEDLALMRLTLGITWRTVYIISW